MLAPADSIIGLPDYEKPIYRVFNFCHLYKLYRERKLFLCRPGKWDDPFENVLLKLRVVAAPSGTEICIRGVLDIFFGQCWSDRPEETDATWRIYAPHENGVRIATTVKKLLNAVYSATDRPPSTSVFVGKVQYESEANIIDMIADPIQAKKNHP